MVPKPLCPAAVFGGGCNQRFAKRHVLAMAMSVERETLAAIRARIDALDDAMAALLIDRLAAVEAVRLAKRATAGQGLALRPAREADILRRLVAATEGKFPKATLVRIYRELLAATTRAQSRLLPVITGTADDLELALLLRDHFGSQTSPLVVASPADAFAALEQGNADLAILPVPNRTDHWWFDWANGEGQCANIVGRLPFCQMAPQQCETYWVIASLPVEASMQDRAVVMVGLAPDVAPARLLDGLRSAGRSPIWIGSAPKIDDGLQYHCIDIGGFAGQIIGELGDLLAAQGLTQHKITVMGGYPAPI